MGRKKKSIEPAVVDETLAGVPLTTPFEPGTTHADLAPPAEEAPDEEAPDEEAPDEEAPDEEAPDEEAPDEEAPAEEAPAEEAPAEEAPAEEPAKTFSITLEGRKGQSLQGAVNGVPFSVPCGIEVTVGEAIYNAVKAHIIPERN